MKKMIFLTLLLLVSLQAYSFSWGRTIKAIARVESNFNEKAVNGIYVGYLQISPVLVKDCNRILGQKGSKKRYTLNDRYNKQKSIEMFITIQSFYNPKNSIEHAIRLWNGGPNYSVKRTQGYYNKVMRYYN